MDLINQHINELRELCDDYHVSKLYVFGSVAKDEHDNSSDIDLLVKFNEVDPLEYFDNYIALKEKLALLFSRDVDLVEVQTVKNPILKKSIDRDKILVYGREDSKMAV